MPRRTHPLLRCGRCGRPCATPEKLRGHERRVHAPAPVEERGPARPGIDYPAPDGRAFKAMTERSASGITSTRTNERTAYRG